MKIAANITPHLFLIVARLLTLAVLCLSATLAQAASLNAKVDRNQISINETLRLEVRYDKKVSASELNYSRLQRHFDVLGMTPQSSSSVSIVNGKSTRVEASTWAITLAPKQAGTFTIPAFSVQGDSSQAIEIKVTQSSNGNSASKPLQVWISASSDRIYPAEQLIVELELSAAMDVADLNGPQLIIKNAEVEPLGQQSFQRNDNGVTRQIVLLKYAVFIDQPGKLQIPTMTYTGIKGGRRSLFGNRGQQVVARSQPLDIAVQNPVTQANKSWLPAKEVTIQSTWSGDTKELKVGEPITRTITVTAKGQRGATIPPLAVASETQDYKSYKDQAKLDTQTQADGLIGRRIESEAIVPAQEGELTLPEIRLSWWNMKSKQWQEAILAAETIQVSAAAISLTPSPSITTDNQQNPPGLAPRSNQLWMLLSGLLGLICLTQFWLIFRSRKSVTTKPTAPLENHNEKQAWRNLQRSLQQQEATKIRHNLLTWAQQALPESGVVNLHSILQQHPSAELKTELGKLEEALYKGGQAIDSKTLGQAIANLRQQIVLDKKTIKGSDSALKPLYNNPQPRKTIRK